MTSFVVVALGTGVYGVPVGQAGSVFRIESLTRVPLSGPELLGLTNLRGKIIPIFSLRRLIDPEAHERWRGALALALEHENETLAIVVDAVDDVVDLGEADRVPVQPHADAAQARITAGVYMVDGRLLPILDVARLARVKPLLPLAA